MNYTTYRIMNSGGKFEFYGNKIRGKSRTVSSFYDTEFGILGQLGSLKVLVLFSVRLLNSANDLD